LKFLGDKMKFLEWIRHLYTPATCEELMARELDAAKRVGRYVCLEM